VPLRILAVESDDLKRDTRRGSAPGGAVEEREVFEVVRVRLESRADAENAVRMIGEQKPSWAEPWCRIGGVDHCYNAVPYEGRGWPTFEAGAALTVTAHLNSLDTKYLLDAGGLARAKRTPKMLDVDASPSVAVQETRGPNEVLEEAITKVSSAARTKFVGSGDRSKVQGMLQDFSDQTAKALLDEVQIGRADLHIDYLLGGEKGAAGGQQEHGESALQRV
jgi:hypothetical protein